MAAEAIVPRRSFWQPTRSPCAELLRLTGTTGVEVVEYHDTPETRRELFEFYRVCYPGKDWFQDHARFEWQVLGGDHRIFLVRENGRIVGHVLALWTPMYIGGVLRCSAYAVTNIAVLPEVAGRKLGWGLLDAMTDFASPSWAIGVTPPALHTYKKRGWMVLNDAAQYLLPFNSKPLQFAGLNKWVARAASGVFRVANAFIRRPYRQRPYVPIWDGGWNGNFQAVQSQVKGVTCREIAEFKDEWTRSWNVYLWGYGIVASRSTSSLNHKYFERNVGHRVLLFERDGWPVGYVVFRVSRTPDGRATLGRIVDIVFNRHHIGLPTAMVAAAIWELRQRDVDGVIGMASCDALKAAFRANGMLIKRSMPVCVEERGFKIADVRLDYREPLYVTLGEADLDGYW